MAYTILDMFSALLMGIVIFIFCYLVGMALIPAGRTEDKERRMTAAMIAPVLGFSVWLGVVNFLYQLSFSEASVTVVVFALSVLVIFIRRKRIAIALPKDIPWLYLTISMLLSCITIYAVFPKIIDGGLYFTSSAYDHARIALVYSIEKNGLPLVAPWSTNKGEFIHVGYHYGIHVLMGYVADITKKDNLIVASAILWTIAEESMLLIGALTIKVSRKRNSLYPALLLIVSSSFAFGILENAVPAGDRFGFWPFMNNLIWSPHHFVAASMVIVVIILTEELLISDTRRESVMISALIGLVTAASAYCSIYSGAIAIFFYIATFLIRMIFDCGTRKDFKRQFWHFMLSVAVGVVFTFPYLLDLIKNAFHVPTLSFGYVPFLPIEEGPFGPLLMFLNMYLVYLPVRLGVQYFFGFIGITGFIIFYINRKRKGITEPGDEFKMRLAVFAILSYVIIFFIHSSIYSNDFGWRTVVPATYIGIAFGSAMLMDVLSKLRKSKLPIKIAVGLILAVMCFGDIDREVLQILIQRDDYPELHKELADIRDGWEEVRKHTGENDIVLCAVDNYSEIIPDLGSGTGNYMFSYYADRYSPMGDYPYAVTSGASMGQDRIDELHTRISKFFAGNPQEEEVNYFADIEKVKAILVVKQDGLFTDEGSIRSRYPNMVEGKYYKVYY